MSALDEEMSEDDIPDMKYCGPVDRALGEQAGTDRLLRIKYVRCRNELRMVKENYELLKSKRSAVPVTKTMRAELEVGWQSVVKAVASHRRQHTYTEEKILSLVAAMQQMKLENEQQAKEIIQLKHEKSVLDKKSLSGTDDEFTMRAMEEGSPQYRPQKKKRKAPVSPQVLELLTQPDLEESMHTIEDDNNIREALSTVRRLSVKLLKKSSELQTEGEIDEHIAENIEDLAGAVNSLYNIYCTSIPPFVENVQKNDITKLKNLVGDIQATIDKTNGKGIHNSIKEATKGLHETIARLEAGEGSMKEVRSTEHADKETMTDAWRIPAAIAQKSKPDEAKPAEIGKNVKPPESKKRAKTRRVPNINQGVIVNIPKNTTYAETVSKIKDLLGQGPTGVSLTGIRRSNTGQVILSTGVGEVAAKTATTLMKEAEKILGPEAIVKQAGRPLHIEIMDISFLEGPEDVERELKSEDPGEDVRVVRLVPAFGGTQRAIVATNESVASRLLKRGKIKIGYVMCRVRLREVKMARCYRCHEFGHMAAGCTGIDRKDKCMTCGETGHIARDCSRPANCELCKEKRKSYDHYPGSGKCEAYRRAKETKNAKTPKG